MARLAISKGFLAEYAKLDKHVQRTVDQAVATFARHPHPGQHLETPRQSHDDRLRIMPLDAEEAGLQVDDSSIGKTGVPWVDFRHRDLVGSKDQFQRLVEAILRCVKELGVRRFSGDQAARFAQFFRVRTISRSCASSAESGSIVALSITRRNTWTMCRSDHSLSHSPISPRNSSASGS